MEVFKMSKKKGINLFLSYFFFIFFIFYGLLLRFAAFPNTLIWETQKNFWWLFCIIGVITLAESFIRNSNKIIFFDEGFKIDHKNYMQIFNYKDIKDIKFLNTKKKTIKILFESSMYSSLEFSQKDIPDFDSFCNVLQENYIKNNFSTNYRNFAEHGDKNFSKDFSLQNGHFSYNNKILNFESIVSFSENEKDITIYLKNYKYEKITLHKNSLNNVFFLKKILEEIIKK